MSTTEGELDVEVPLEREDGEVRMNFYLKHFHFNYIAVFQ